MKRTLNQYKNQCKWVYFIFQRKFTSSLTLTRLLVLLTFILSEFWFTAVARSQEISLLKDESEPVNQTIPFGYVRNTVKERKDRYVEVHIQKPYIPVEKSFNDLVFTPELMKDMKAKYYEKFGTLDPGGTIIQQGQWDPLDVYQRDNLKMQQLNLEKRQYGEYVLKRLTEWHMDRYFKNEPQLSRLYEVKQKLSNVQVEVAPKVQLKFQYSFSASTFDGVLINPWVDAKFVIYMDPNSVVPGTSQGTSVFIGKNLSKKYRLQGQYVQSRRETMLELLRIWSPEWITFVGAGASTYGRSSQIYDENKILIGVRSSIL